MRSQTTLLAGLSVLAFSSLVGCSSTSYHKSNAAAASMQEAAKEVQAESKALDATLTAAKGLVNDPGTDIRKPYRQFRASLDHLVDARNLESLADWGIGPVCPVSSRLDRQTANLYSLAVRLPVFPRIRDSNRWAMSQSAHGCASDGQCLRS